MPDEPKTTPNDDPAKPPDDAKPPTGTVTATAEDLEKMIRAASETSAERALNAYAKAVEQTPPPTTGTTNTALEEERQRRLEQMRDMLNEGKGDEVIKMLEDSALNPLANDIRQLGVNQGQINVDRLKQRYGEKFTKREQLFKQVQRKYGVTDAQLGNQEMVDRLWYATLFEDKDAYLQEEVDERLEAAKKEMQQKLADQSSTGTPALMPVTDFISGDSPDEIKRLADEYFSDDPKERAYELGQIAAYGITVEGFLRQHAKSDDPRYTYGAGVGKYWRPTWTIIRTEEPKKPA